MDAARQIEPCPICQARQDDPKYRFLLETEHWRAVLAPNQCLLGRCVVHLKRHAGSLSQLDPEEVRDWLELVKDIEAALRQAFSPALFNWGCYMNLAFRAPIPNPHVHWWAVPRYAQPVEFDGFLFEDPDFGSPYDHSRWLEVPPEVHQHIAERITACLE